MIENFIIKVLFFDQNEKQLLAPWRPTQKLPRFPATSPSFIMNIQRGGAVFEELDIPRQRADELRCVILFIENGN